MKKRVLVTRALEQGREFADLLQNLGLEPVVFPLIEFIPPKEKSKFEDAVNNLASYDWILLTSANAVRFFVKYLKTMKVDLSLIEGIKVCAVGPKTAEVARELSIKIDLIPDNFQAEGVIKSFQSLGIEGKKILFPRAEEGRAVLPEGLSALGAEVSLVPVYQTVEPEGKEDELKNLLKNGLDVITFTSGSTVRNFVKIVGRENLALIKNIKIACISEVTAKVGRDQGFEVAIVASENTTQSLAESIAKFFT